MCSRAESFVAVFIAHCAILQSHLHKALDRRQAQVSALYQAGCEVLTCEGANYRLQLLDDGLVLGSR